MDNILSLKIIIWYSDKMKNIHQSPIGPGEDAWSSYTDVSTITCNLNLFCILQDMDRVVTKLGFLEKTGM